MTSKGAEMIAAERQRQIEEEGWTPEHDAQHTNGELADAAAAYALTDQWDNIKHNVWPWAPQWWKPKDRIRDLVRAGALIAAEIDRLLALDNARG